MKKVSILKHNLMRAAMTLALIMTCATAWAQNPNLADYTFTTGQDASKWITLSDNATQMIASGNDDANSSMTNIGFDFPFGDGTYSQFWTSSNGILSFNSVQADSRNWQFRSYNNEYQANQPKICGISADMSTGNNGYVKYELTGTEPNRVLVCEFFLYGVSYSTNYAATIKWQVQLHEADAKVVMVYGDALDTNLCSNQIGLSQSESDIWTIHPSTHEAIHSTGAVTSTYNTWPGANRYYEFNPPVPFTNNGDGTYTINTATGWGVFCDMLADGESFSGKTVNLGANITITRMASTGDPYFRGTFDGQGHTLTLDYGTANDPIDAQFVAPFVMTYWNTSPTFRNLTIDGHIYSTCTANVDGKNTGGLIGHLYGDVTIEHCTSNVEIINSSGGVGGFVGLCEHTVNFNDCLSSAVIHSAGGNNSGFVSWSRASGYEINFTGCVFNGKLLQINGNGHSNGGFIGWTGSNKTVTITNCLYAPAALAEGEAYASYNSATFARGWNATTTATNSYYTTDFNDGTNYTGQGTQAYSITAGENVTVDYAGTATAYATSGITSYVTGIKYNNVLYAGNEETISLTLGNTPPQGSLFMGYTVSPEGTTLNGTTSPYTLTMPDENVIIGAVIKDPVTYLDENGVQQTKQPSEYTILTNTMTTLGTANQETWYVADGTLNFNQTINVNGVVHLILKDNAVMDVGTAESPITGSGISSSGPSISIYGQSTGSDIGMLSVYATFCGIYDYDWGEKNNDPTDDYAVTINGGYIYLSSDQYGIQSKKVTINGGQVSATAGLSGIASYPNAITLGWTSPYDLIYADAYQGDVIVKSGKAFIHSDYPPEVVTGTVSDYSLINGKFLRPAVAVTLNDDIAAGSGIISSGENLYAQAAVPVTVDASNVIAPTGYAVSGITVTPTVTVTDNHDGTYSFTVPAADVTVSATFALQPVSVNYLDENGVEHTVDALPLLGGEATTLAAGWYVVNSDISYTGTVSLVGSGDVKLILADDHTMNVGTSENRIEYGIKTYNNAQTLTIYGQSTGDHMGILSVYSSHYCIYPVALTINGGHVIANADGNYASALRTTYQPITINGGTVEATATGNDAYAIFAANYFFYAGGTLTTSAASGNAIYAYYPRYTFTWRNPNDRITIGSTGLYAPDDTYTATFNKLFTDGTNIYSGTLRGDQISALAGKTLYPYSDDVIPYLNENGQQRYCVEYTTLTGSENSLGTEGQETWYVADGAIDFDHQISTVGDVHLILKDGAVMNVGTESSRIEDTGISVGQSLSIYAQSTGESKGQLNVYGTAAGIRSPYGSVTINGGEVTATGNTSGIDGNVTIINGGQVTAISPYNDCIGGTTVTINGGQVTAYGEGSGIHSYFGNVNINGGQVTANIEFAGIVAHHGDVNISGGQVTASGEDGGIIASYGNINLGWTKSSDFINVNRYNIEEFGTLSIAEGKAFIDEAGNTYSGTIEQVSGAYSINGKTLYPQGVILKPVPGYGNSTESDHWVFIASPLAGSIAPTDVHNLLGSYDEVAEKYDYDLYRFNQRVELEWQNYNNPEHTAGFNLVNGQGYLYATKETRTLVFAGTPYSGSGEVTLVKDGNADLSGWNLVGNPFTVNTYIDRPFYIMNEGGSEIIAATQVERNYIKPMEGIIVYANEDGEIMTFTPNEPSKGHIQKPEPDQVVLNLSRPSTGSGTGSTAVIDRAIVRMGEGQTLPKFQIRENSTKLYIPQNGKDYAIVSVGNVGEIPVNFRANENGTYTLTISETLNSQLSTLNSQLSTINYLHLIDNMTGADVDLLQTPEYTFNAKVRDYESRFKLVFVANDASTGSASDATFAFYSNGSWIIANEGEATLQVIDLNGRILSSETVNGSVSKSIHAAPGVYMIRLINGEKVKVQKVIIE